MIAGLPAHLEVAGQVDRLREVLTTFDFLQAKVNAFGPERLIDDYDLVSDPSFDLIQSALRIAAHVIRSDPTQLAGQLAGRLMMVQDGPIRSLLDQRPITPVLLPVLPSLTQAGGVLERTVRCERLMKGVAIMPDGNTAITSSSDGLVQMWDLNTGNLLYTSGKIGYDVGQLALTHDGHLAVIATYHGIVVWDVIKRTPRFLLRGHEGPTSSAAISPDGKIAVSGGGSEFEKSDGLVRVWDIEQGIELFSLGSHADGVMSVALHRQAHYVLAGSKNSEVKLWDLKTRTECHVLTGARYSVESVVFSPDGTLCVAADEIGTLVIWALESGKVLQTATWHNNKITSLTFTDDSQYLFIASRDGGVSVYEVKTNKVVQHLDSHSSGVYSVSVSAHARRAVSASYDETLKVWDRPTLVRATTSSNNSRPVSIRGRVRGLRFISGPPLGAAATEQGIHLINLDQRHQGGHYLGWDGEREITILALSPDGKRVGAVIGTRGVIEFVVWETATGRQLVRASGARAAVYYLSGGAALSADGMCAVAAHTTNRGAHAPIESRVHFWKLGRRKSSRLLFEMIGEPGSVEPALAAGIVPNGRLALGAFSRSLRVWDTRSGKLVQTLNIPNGRLTAASFTADGNLAICVIGERTLQVWDIERHTLRSTIETPVAGIKDVAITPDGLRAATAANDGALKVWNTVDGTLIASFNDDGPLEHLAISDDGLSLVAIGSSNLLHYLKLFGVSALERLKPEPTLSRSAKQWRLKWF